jgi:ISXO2-like transposase domain
VQSKLTLCETASRTNAVNVTQTIEGFWSIIKRGIVGSFHKVSRKYMPLYVAEFQFRYSNRSNPDIFGTAIGGC